MMEMMGQVVRQYYNKPAVYFDGSSLTPEQIKRAKESVSRFRIRPSKHGQLFLVGSTKRAVDIMVALNDIGLPSKAQAYDAAGNPFEAPE